jgi:hypothetical protein
MSMITVAVGIVFLVLFFMVLKCSSADIGYGFVFIVAGLSLGFSLGMIVSWILGPRIARLVLRNVWAVRS